MITDYPSLFKFPNCIYKFETLLQLFRLFASVGPTFVGTNTILSKKQQIELVLTETAWTKLFLLNKII